MNDHDKSKEALISELEDLRRRLAASPGPAAGAAAEAGDPPSGRWWQSLVAHAPLFIVLVDRDLRIRYLNRSGPGTAVADLLGKSLCDFCHPDQWDQIRAAVERVFSTGQPWVHEGLARSTDEDQRWYQGLYGPVYEDGRIVAVSLFAVDATARKRTETELDRSRAMLTAAIECLPFDFFALDPQGRCVLQNALSRQYFGNALGKTAEEVCPDPRALPRWLESTRRALAGQRVSHEAEIQLQGQRRDFYSIVAPIQQDGAVCGVLGVNVDITDRKRTEAALHQAHDELERRVAQRTAQLLQANQQLQREVRDRTQAEEALRQSHDELQAIYDGMFDGLLIVDAQSKRYVKANSSICRMLGYTEAEMLTRSTMDIHPAQEVPIALGRIQARAEGRLIGHIETLLLRQDGGILHADVVGSRLSYRGRPCVVSFFRDITQQKRDQEALERERQSLWQMLQASDHDRRMISYEIHDGLAQYLAAAGMQFQAHDSLRESQPEEAAQSYRTAVELVRQSHAEARRLISDLRPPVIDEIGLETAVAHLVHEHRRRGSPNILCETAVQFQRLPSILEDSLYRIAQEALTNACKHSKSDRVAVRLSQEGSDVRLEVRDWGIGFDPQAVPKRRFGLEGIRQRVRLLGGRLTLDSQLKVGTLVQVVVPIVEKPNAS